MIELPEANTLARQVNQCLAGKRICGVQAGMTPHKLAWFHGNPAGYGDLLLGAGITGARAVGGFLSILAGEAEILFGEGIEVRWFPAGSPRPERHQFLLEFDDASALVAVTRLYGGLGAFPRESLDNPYYRVALAKPSPLGPEFTREYFDQAVLRPELAGKSVKFVLATEQRIPGLGNGVLQDILFAAGLNPRRPSGDLGSASRDRLYRSVVETLRAMTDLGGRNTDKDLLGQAGGYVCRLCAATAGTPCPECGAPIMKGSYLGGNVYWCPDCQPR